MKSIASRLGNTRAIIASRYQIPELSKLEGDGYMTHDLDVIGRVKGDDKADYKNDVYISYVHNDITSKWIEKTFLPLFKDILDNYLTARPRMFFDMINLDIGVSWLEQLKDNLLHSKILVAILTPRYFQSHRAMAEWLTFTEKTRLTNSNLLIPIVLTCGNYLDNPLINKIQRLDFTSYNLAGDYFYKTKKYLHFQEEISTLSSRLGSILNRPPVFDPEWPVIGPDKAPEIIAQSKEEPISFAEEKGKKNHWKKV